MCQLRGGLGLGESRALRACVGVCFKFCRDHRNSGSVPLTAWVIQVLCKRVGHNEGTVYGYFSFMLLMIKPRALDMLGK